LLVDDGARSCANWTRVLILEFNWSHEAFDDVLLVSPPAVRAVAANVLATTAANKRQVTHA
jgi:hypothetical protein